ncbi:kinase-like domain-containing protein [Cerioporus squamosus]|nr:kinase-like domain-containing protein [Cerioporus squamosus]
MAKTCGCRSIPTISLRLTGQWAVAVHTVTGQKVAMKFKTKHAIAKHRTKTRVQRKVEYMRTLRHPHIIIVYEVISTPSDIIVLPRLKPENVLLDDDLNVKIADFGLSIEIKDGDFLKTSCGSPNYAALEVIRGGLYTGPEIDVWSCGVILYVMLCGRLPFLDDDVQTLFSKISQDVYHLPSYLSPEAKGLINGMLAVDPVKRITIPEIMQHPFFAIDPPNYLIPLSQQGPVLGTLSSLDAPPKALDFDFTGGLGRIEEDVVEDFTARMERVDKDDVWECLRRDDGPQSNAVKVAYMLLRDKRRAGKNLAEYEQPERDAKLATMDPRCLHTPNAVSSGGGMDLEENPIDSEFNDYDKDDEDNVDFPTSQNEAENNNCAVLNSSLPEQRPEQHHLQLRRRSTEKWHFGIRSRSLPMEVMLDIYRRLKTLEMECKGKGDLGGLGATALFTRSEEATERRSSARRSSTFNGCVDLRAASSIYSIETRAQVQDVVVLMNLQLYMLDSINHLVDFQYKKTYKASSEPGVGKFDMANPDANMSETASKLIRWIESAMDTVL